MSSNLFFDFISKSIINSLSERLSKQLNIKSEYIQKALYDENFTIKNEVRIDINENENNVEQVKNEVRIDIQESEINVEQVKNKEDVLLEGGVMGNVVPHLDISVYIYDFYNLEYQDSEEFWKHKRIKIENKYYRLHLATNLILDPRKDGTLVLIGMRNVENECMNIEELDPIVFKWCDVHSIHYKY
jgi:hypothetical protein